MRALIAQHGSVLATLAALQQHPKGQHNDKQTDSLENLVPHINVPTEFNQDTSESARERRNCLLRKRHVRQCTELAGPFETPQERNNCMC